jgi:hypothetical protein
MSWELLLLGGLIIGITTVAFIAMRKTRPSEFASFGGGQTVNADELAAKIAKAMGAEMRAILKEFKEELKNLPVSRTSTGAYHSGSPSAAGGIQMDESLIPTKIETNADLKNLENMAKEEAVVDKGLSESKSKLASLLKRKKKE